jgi:Tfp pilus assembly protein PilO
MSTTFVEFGGAASMRPFLSHWIKRARMPLEAWSRRRRWVVALLIAAIVFALGTHGWIVADFSGVGASRSALAASAQRLADARHALAQLPVLRQEIAAMGVARSSASWSSADDVRVVSELAVQSDVTLLSLEPGAVSGVGVESMRPLQFTARTDFVHLMAFLRGLSDLPVLTVPVDVTVKRDTASLVMNATVNMFSALRPVPLNTSADAFVDASLDSDDEDLVFFDPFSPPQMFAAGSLSEGSPLRLVGLLRDRTRGLALLDTEDGATTVVAGQLIGAERVTKLDARGITLARGDETRTLSLMEAS